MPPPEPKGTCLAGPAATGKSVGRSVLFSTQRHFNWGGGGFVFLNHSQVVVVVVTIFNLCCVSL